MPFMVGPAPIRRTLKYLESGKIIFRDTVKIFSVNYNSVESEKTQHHRGIQEFLFWHLNQIQHKNPNVQCITWDNLTPSPFIKVYLENMKTVLIDLEGRTKEEIHDHLKNFAAICKTDEELQYDEITKVKTDNPANFGYNCQRHCLCEVLGQVPCPQIVPVPFHRRGIGGPVPLTARIPDYIKYAKKEHDLVTVTIESIPESIASWEKLAKPKVRHRFTKRLLV